MTIQPDTPVADDLLSEVNVRMSQALDNFFQRSRTDIQDAILRAIGLRMEASMLAIGQTCVDWLNVHPDKLSAAFANQFRLQLDRPETFAHPHQDHPPELQLVDDAMLGRQLAENKAANRLTEDLQPELLLLFSRLLALRKTVRDENEQTDVYGPHAVMRALSRALDSLDFDSHSGTLLMQCATPPLYETLKQTYTALNQFLSAQGVQEHTTVIKAPTPRPRRSEPAIGQEILAYIQSAATLPHGVSASSPHTQSRGDESAAHINLEAVLPRFLDSLAHWQASQIQTPASATAGPGLVLRQLQQEAHQTDAGAFDLAILDAVAGLFEFILDDPIISPRYKSLIAQLQIPVLRVALATPEFFSDDQHPARQLIDLTGQYSRRFPEHNHSHQQALAQVETACSHILDDPAPRNEVFERAHAELAAWLADENLRSEAELASEVANLEQIERQELGTLLALENLNDLTARYPAPVSVLRRLEAAWVPHMAAMYVSEAGEGPEWRAACKTLLDLFLSMQPPDNDDTREIRLQSIPHINAELRHGLQQQGADSAHLKDFFSAITATQASWIRPDSSQREDVVNAFVPLHAPPRESIETLAQRLTDPSPHDPILLMAEQLLEGDWVDFDPPYEGLDTARVAWVGVNGYLLFCDSAGEQRFSLDCDQLAEEIHAGRAHIPEQSLTRKAMLRLKTQFSAPQG